MKIIDINKEKSTVNTNIALGNFDGLHKGHMALVDKVIDLSNYGKESALLLFRTHSRFTKNARFLSSLEDKLDILSKTGLENVFVVDFNKEFSSLNADQFIKNILIDRCRSKTIVVGQDYHFAKGAKADVNTLKTLQSKYDYKLYVVDDVKEANHLISSTEIKDLLLQGKISKANALLGRPYMIKGIVSKGFGRGKNIGYPTANIVPDFPYLVPKDGVYFSLVQYNSKIYNSMTSIGNNPTFNDVDKCTIEVFIDKFNKDIYEEEIKLYFLEYLRPMESFESVDALIKQLDSDYLAIKDLYKLYNK